jgi:hypothetical protein
MIIQTMSRQATSGATWNKDRTITADAAIWRAAGILSGMLARTQGYGREQRRRVLNDALLFETARKHGCTVLTRNVADFDLLPQLDPFGAHHVLHRPVSTHHLPPGQDQWLFSGRSPPVPSSTIGSLISGAKSHVAAIRGLPPSERPFSHRDAPPILSRKARQ